MMAEQVQTVEMEDNKDLIIVFRKPFEYEGVTHTEIDLRNLENVTTEDLAYCDSKSPGMMPEFTLNYHLHLAARITKKPIEFYRALPGREGLKIKNAMMSFLNASE